MRDKKLFRAPYNIIIGIYCGKIRLLFYIKSYAQVGSSAGQTVRLYLKGNR